MIARIAPPATQASTLSCWRCGRARPQRLSKLMLAMAGGSVVLAPYFCKMFYYTYVLRSTKDKDLYVGWTDDLKNRLRAHNNGEVDATRNRRPLMLEYCEACKSREKAIAREKYFKTGFGRRFLKERM